MLDPKLLRNQTTFVAEQLSRRNIVFNVEAYTYSAHFAWCDCYPETPGVAGKNPGVAK